MDPLEAGDVPYGDDWDDAAEVVAWTEASDGKRPWRTRIREAIASRVTEMPPGAHVVELGAGPGLLAHAVLDRCPSLGSYTLVDFSEPMLALSRARLAAFPRARFARASFKSDDWPRQVEHRPDCVLSMQAVHELRNKSHAPRLYAAIHQVLAASGWLLICDHTPFDDSPQSTTLYMTEGEQLDVLSRSGFSGVRVDLALNGLVLYAAEKRAI